MGVGRTLKGDKVLEYLDKYKGLSKQAIARVLYNETQLFDSIEQARQLVRNYTGSHGKHHKMHQKGVIEYDNRFSRDNPYGLPESYEEKREPFILPKVNNNILIISDLHIPYHTIKAVNCAIKYGVEQKVNTIFINGDLLDFHGLSRFEKDPRKRTVPQEMDAAIEFFKVLRKVFPKADIYYHLGNHDVRYERWLMAHPEIFGDPYYELENRLGLNNFGVRMIDDRTITKAGKLSIHHGHYMFRGAQSPVSPARTMLLKAKQSMVCGHTHKISEATATNLEGHIYSCWSTGSLCELLPDYTPMCNDYAHGFAHAVIDDSGDFMIRNMRIHEGRIL